MALRKFVFINSSEGFSQEQASNDELSLGKITLLGVEGVAIHASDKIISGVAAGVATGDAVNKGQLEQVETDYQAADAVVLDSAESYTDGRETQMRTDWAADDATTLASANSYADSLLAGFTVKAPVKAATTANITLSGEQNIDGVALVAGNRILVKDQTDATQNGIYVVAAGAWSRAADANANAEVKDGLSVFVEQGTVNSDDTFVLITNNTITLGTSELTFQKFSGIGQVTAGDGLSKTADTLAVNVGDGIAIVSDAVAVNLATDPGLQFTANKLDLKLDANGALSKDSAGLKAVSASADRLSVSSSGLDVVGLPSTFKLAGTAVSANVTKANLDKLVDGNAGNADALHSHLSHQAKLLSGGNAAKAGVAFNSSGKIVDGACTTTDTLSSRIVGVAMEAKLADESALVVFSGPAAGVLTSATIGTPYYLGSTGQPVLYSTLTAGQRIIRLGYAMSASDLFVSIQDMGQKA